VRHFVHGTRRYVDPGFLHEERRWLDHERDVLHVMERHRDHVVHDIEHARSLARRAHIPIDRDLEPDRRKRLALIGIGDPRRSDDAAGLEVAQRLRRAAPAGVTVLEQEGEPTTLLEAWAGATEALVIDGVDSGAEPGTLHRFEVTGKPLPAELFRPSTHELGVAEAVELARELGRLPGRLAVYGIEGESFEPGEGLSPTVLIAVERLVAELHQELGAEGPLDSVDE